MAHYYTFVESMKQADRLVEQLKQKGVDKDDISIVMASPTNEQDPNFSADKLMDTDVTVEDAPAGTIGSFGAAFAVVTALTGGAALLAAGPIIGLLTGGAVAAGAAGLLLSGVGVPEEKHPHTLERLERGHILIQVDGDYDNQIGVLFKKQPIAA